MISNNEEDNEYIEYNEYNDQEPYENIQYPNSSNEIVIDDELYEEYQIYTDELGKEYIYVNGEPILLEEADSYMYEEAIQDYDDEEAYKYFKETPLVEPPIITSTGSRKKRNKERRRRNSFKPKQRETKYDGIEIIDRKKSSQPQLKQLIDSNSFTINCNTCKMDYFISQNSYNKYKIIFNENNDGTTICSFLCPVCDIRNEYCI
uniref:TFIIS-type domain-containing protein n=1 Tax=Parastrongyloides trichosuri TaxID=131310 RepID=A0A0N4ZZ85_PARTI